MENASAATAAAAPAPRYAPHDPTLPEPWRALVDTSTGYIYYWNPQTNITQYERPVAQPPPPAAPPLPPGPPPSAATTTSSSFYPQSAVSAPPQSNAQQGGATSDSVHSNSNGVLRAHPKLAPIPVPRNHHQGIGELHLQHASAGHPNPSGMSGELGTRPNMLKHGASNHSSAGQDIKRQKIHGFSDHPNASDVEAYKRQHEVTAVGDNVPAPFITFDAAALPPEILREVRYLLQIGAHVVRCAAVQQKRRTLLSSVG